jgi:hypothetical protein
MGMMCGPVKGIASRTAVDPRGWSRALAGAVQLVLREEADDRAAIASARAAILYGAEIIAERLEDHPENSTRLLLLAGPEPTSVAEALAALKGSALDFRLLGDFGRGRAPPLR